MVRYEDVKEFWDYLEFYPDGGIKGIRPDAPSEARIAFQNYMQDMSNSIKV